MSDLIDRQPVITAADEAADFELNFTLHHPITEEEWDAIADVDFDHTDNIFFHTKNGKEVEFVKRKKGKWDERSVFDAEGTGIAQMQSARCSACGKYHTTPYLYFFDNFNFCPNCGADMRGEENG